jgi:apolipoprotein N-acyltransferase
MEEDVNREKCMSKVQKKINLILVLGSLLSLLIVALGQPARFGWLSALAAALGFTLFFGTIPKRWNRKKRFLLGAAWFAAVELIQLSWMTSIEFQGYYILAIYVFLVCGLACQFGLLTLYIPAEGSISIFKLLACAALWTMMEWLRLFFMCGFSWNPIGLALTHFTSALQMTSLFGVFGLSFWVMLTNLFGVNALRARFSVYPTVCWALLACFPYLFGVMHLNYHFAKSQNHGESPLTVALVQTALLPSEKIPDPGRMQDFVSPFDQWQRICHSLSEKQRSKWDLIVLPEAAVPLLSDLGFYQFEAIREILVNEFGYEILSKFPPLTYPYAEEQDFLGKKVLCVSNLFLCQTLANYYQAEIVAGLNHSDQTEGKHFNSAFYLKPHSLTHERYDKQILLPLAEYLPFDCLRPLAKSYGIVEFFSHGKEAKVFGQKIPFSVAICYEETFSEIMRQGREKGAKLFINITNDNYYPHSTLHEQHFSHARLRAVENGAPLIRACNSGVTAAISSLGETISRFDVETPSSQRQEGTLGCHVTPYQYSTLFSCWGDAGIVSCCMIILFGYWRLRLKRQVKS